MINEIRDAIVQYLSADMKENDAVLALRSSSTPGILTPCIIRKKANLNQIETGFFHLNNLAVYLSEFFQRENNLSTLSGCLYILCKPCDTKAVIQMISDQQINSSKLKLIVYACDGMADIKKIKNEIGLDKDYKNIELHQTELSLTLLDGSPVSIPLSKALSGKCLECNKDYHLDLAHVFIGDEKKWKANLYSGKYTEKKQLLQDQKTGKDLFEQLKAELSTCIRCNACRNVCHACFCSDRCIFDKPKMTVGFLDKEIAPMDNILYHMIRFYHVAPNCTACGECERICPQGIPLSHLYEYFHRLMQESLDFSAGSSDSFRQAMLSYRLGEDLV
jgi:formate dehydrogenase (coenzyme F420) beta subunit